jgi:hypothetical protein
VCVCVCVWVGGCDWMSVCVRASVSELARVHARMW